MCIRDSVYDPVDQQLVEQRVAQFADQTRRFLDGQLTEDEFRVLRRQNGLYIQRHAPMRRVAIPYGILDVYKRQGLHIVIGETGQFALSHAAFYGVGIYTAGLINNCLLYTSRCV